MLWTPDSPDFDLSGLMLGKSHGNSGLIRNSSDHIGTGCDVLAGCLSLLYIAIGLLVYGSVPAELDIKVLSVLFKGKGLNVTDSKSYMSR